MPTNPTVRNPSFLQQVAGSGVYDQQLHEIQQDVYARTQRMKKMNSAVNALMAQPDIKAVYGSPVGRRLQANGAKSGAAQAPIKAGRGERGQIIRAAESQLGKPYVWGGSSPGTSFDCSGLVQWAYDRVGMKLPRVSADQARYGRRVPINQLRKGDLVAWDNSSRNVGADHIAIYVGNGRIIEAARTGTPIRVRSLGSSEGAWGVQILR